MHGESVGDDSVTAAYENVVQHLDRPEGIKSDDSSEPDFSYKKKIILNFDKMDLARKLEEMTKTVNEYKNHWQGTKRTDSEPRSREIETSRSPRHRVNLKQSSKAKKSHEDSFRNVEDLKKK